MRGRKVRFLPDSGDGGAAAVTVEELVEDCWSDQHGQGCSRDSIARWNQTWILSTQAALDRLLEN